MPRRTRSIQAAAGTFAAAHDFCFAPPPRRWVATPRATTDVSLTLAHRSRFPPRLRKTNADDLGRVDLAVRAHDLFSFFGGQLCNALGEGQLCRARQGLQVGRIAVEPWQAG